MLFLSHILMFNRYFFPITFCFNKLFENGVLRHDGQLCVSSDWLRRCLGGNSSPNGDLKMAALITGIFWPYFCTVRGRGYHNGDTSAIFYTN